jgi:hypothetical protein
MRKLLVLAAMLAMMLAAATPAFAQSVDTGDVAGGDQVNVGNETVHSAVSHNVISTFSASVVQGTTTVDASAVAGGDAVVVAGIDQSQNVSLVQSNVVVNDEVFGQSVALARVHGR